VSQRALVVALLVLLFASLAPSNTAAQDTTAAARRAAADSTARRGPPPLFQANDVLAITLIADFDQIDDDRTDESPERPAVLEFDGAGGAKVRLDIQVKTRGIFRLQRSTCQMPNLRLNIRTGQARGTVFERQDLLKLVGYCRDRDDYEQNVIEEYLAYRLFNAITDVSFRVRLLEVTYQDVDRSKKPITRYGFVIEDSEAMADRVKARIVANVNVISPYQLDPEPAIRQDLFQYMIGNTDFSTSAFHNAELLKMSDSTYQSVPYDFDWSGLVNASYATPDPRLGTRSVTERVYRGYCRPQSPFAPEYAFFQEKREALLDVLRKQPELAKNNVDRAVGYVTEFYGTVGSPRNAQSQIERRCLGKG
jgi:hypothetical protein